MRLFAAGTKSRVEKSRAAPSLVNECGRIESSVEAGYLTRDVNSYRTSPPSPTPDREPTPPVAASGHRLLHVLVGTEHARAVLNGHAASIDFCSPSPVAVAVWIARHPGPVHLFVDLGALLDGDLPLIPALLRHRPGSEISSLNTVLYPHRANAVAGLLKLHNPQVPAAKAETLPPLPTRADPEPLLTPDELAMLLDDRGLT